MNRTEVMKSLKAAGDERYRKTLTRHGVDGNSFGVSYAELYKLQKRIGTDQALAEQLWKTGNHDARVLATLVADPAQMTVTKLDEWVKTSHSQITREAIASVAVKSTAGKRCAKTWIEARPEVIAATGWWVLAGMAERPGAFSDAELSRYLKRIRKEIGGERNRVKHSMNQAIIGIGVRNPEMRKRALDVAEAVGKVEVDHGETACKTPDAGAYILKVLAHRRKQRKAAEDRAPKGKPAARNASPAKAPAKTKAKTRAKATAKPAARKAAPAKASAKKTAKRQTAARRAPTRKTARKTSRSRTAAR